MAELLTMNLLFDLDGTLTDPFLDSYLQYLRVHLSECLSC